MGTPNTRKLDQLIKSLQNRLEGIRAYEMWALSPKDQAKVVFHGSRGAVKVARGKNGSSGDRAAERVFADAEAALSGELAAAMGAKSKILSDHAKAKVAKRQESSWW